MPRTDPDPSRPATGYFAYWIDRLRLADELPPPPWPVSAGASAPASSVPPPQ